MMINVALLFSICDRWLRPLQCRMRQESQATLAGLSSALCLICLPYIMSMDVHSCQEF